MRKIGVALALIIIISFYTLVMFLEHKEGITKEFDEYQAKLNSIEAKVSLIDEKYNTSELINSVDEIQNIIDIVYTDLAEIQNISELDLSADFSKINNEISIVSNQIEELKMQLPALLPSFNASVVTQELSDQAENVNTTVETEALAIKNELNSLASDLKNISTGLNGIKEEIDNLIPNDILREADIDTLASEITKSIAESNALSESEDKNKEVLIAKEFYDNAYLFEYPDLFYLAAIAHDPLNSDYYIAYLSYLDEIVAGPSYYVALGTLLENAIISTSYDNGQPLIEIYKDVINRITPLETEIEIESITPEDIISQWNNALTNFYSYGEKVFSIKEFEDIYNQAYDAYMDLSSNGLSEAKDDQEFEQISEISSTVDMYSSVNIIASNMAKLTNDEFTEIYPNLTAMLDSISLSFATRNLSADKTYQTTISALGDSINETIRSLDNRYDEGLISSLYQEIFDESIITRVLINNTLYSDYLLKYTLTVSQLRDASKHIAKLSEIQNQLDVIAKALSNKQYTDYQLWAGAQIDMIDSALDEAENEMKLQVLISNGYYNIDANLLIPELLTAYNELMGKNFEKNSATSLDSLLKRYPIEKKGLGDV